MKYKNHSQQSHSFPQRQRYPTSESDSQSESDSSQPQPVQLMNTEIQRVIKEQLKSVPYELILKQTKPVEVKDNQAKTQTIPKKQGRKIKKSNFQKPTKQYKDEALEVSIHQRPKKKSTPIFQSERKKAIDPRFESYAGHYNQDLAMKSYDFIPKLQQAEIKQLKSKLKNPSKKNKINPHDREVLSKEYNKITNQYRRGELVQLQKQTKNQMKTKFGQNFHVSKKNMKEEFQRKKLTTLSEGDREKKIKEKMVQIRRGQLNQRRKSLHFKSK